MVIARPELTPPPWANPIWPDPLPKSRDLRVLYGAVADELVVLFDDVQRPPGIFDFIDTPDETYAAIKIDMQTGAVIGVLVYPLTALAVRLHPDWRAAGKPNPSPDIANRIVMDIRRLYDQYGPLPDEAETD